MSYMNCANNHFTIQCIPLQVV